MKEAWREYLSHLFLIAAGLSLLVILIHVAIYGSCRVYEDKAWVLGLEIFWGVGAVALGVERAYHTLKTKSR
jgi:hypothetical protein